MYIPKITTRIVICRKRICRNIRPSNAFFKIVSTILSSGTGQPFPCIFPSEGIIIVTKPSTGTTAFFVRNPCFVVWIKQTALPRIKRNICKFEFMPQPQIIVIVTGNHSLKAVHQTGHLSSFFVTRINGRRYPIRKGRARYLFEIISILGKAKVVLREHVLLFGFRVSCNQSNIGAHVIRNGIMISQNK